MLAEDFESLLRLRHSALFGPAGLLCLLAFRRGGVLVYTAWVWAVSSDLYGASLKTHFAVHASSIVARAMRN